MCRQKSETIEHIILVITGNQSVTQTKYLKRPNLTANIIHKKICSVGARKYSVPSRMGYTNYQIDQSLKTDLKSSLIDKGYKMAYFIIFHFSNPNPEMKKMGYPRNIRKYLPKT